METSPNMTMTMVSVLDRAVGIGDPGRVDGEGGVRPDPEVPERARRRTFTAAYKLEVLAAYDAAPEGEKGAVLPRSAVDGHMSEVGSVLCLVGELRFG
jgi:transposase